eukprot:Gregarina_sp_Poly_1__2370@NODE_1635_length_3667_cov_217_740556_g1079_i0_p7_GENE_NODE_1635_length_3667_cov_217_740556_g1079_i0NODE_1635_length_3667_cov_217_740556_g1079_i0_p7_ORF_typecomplete_len102_score10_79_NODE_1635_length_3667_cov_217_740556_g1079_i010241329
MLFSSMSFGSCVENKFGPSSFVINKAADVGLAVVDAVPSASALVCWDTFGTFEMEVNSFPFRIKPGKKPSSSINTWPRDSQKRDPTFKKVKPDPSIKYCYF